MRIDEIGATRVWVKADTAAFLFHPDCHEQLLAAWDNNERRFTGRDLYGDPLTVKIADIVAVGLLSLEAIAIARQEEEDERQREALG